MSIADNYKVKAENATQLRNLKLNYFAKHQDYYALSEAHFRIIGELAKAYNADIVGVSEIIRNLGPIKLYTTRVNSLIAAVNILALYIYLIASIWQMVLLIWTLLAKI